MNKSGLVCLGRIVGAHGVKGDVRIESFCADPASLASYGPLVTGNGRRELDLGIRKSVGNRLVATIAGVDTREQAESLKDAFLYAERNRFPEPETEEHYVADLIGLKAVDTSMHGLGIVVAVQNYGVATSWKSKSRHRTRRFCFRSPRIRFFRSIMAPGGSSLIRPKGSFDHRPGGNAVQRRRAAPGERFRQKEYR